MADGNNKVLQEIPKFDPSLLKHVDKVEARLPSKEDIENERNVIQETLKSNRMSINQSVEQFDLKGLKKATTVEKNVLQMFDKEAIVEENKEGK